MLKRISQEGFKDCGPVCLQMIIKFYKGYIDLEEIKEGCKTNKKGTNAYNLIKYAQEIGFESYGIKTSLEDTFILPCIAHITIENSYNHFVVIEKIDIKKRIIYVKDPANLKIKYTFDEFNLVFDGIVIILFPISKIPFNQEYNIKTFVARLLYTSKKQLIQLVVISFFVTIFAIFGSFYLQFMIDNYHLSIMNVNLIFLLFLTICILKLVSDFLRNKILILINKKIDFNLTYETFKQIILLPYKYYKNHTTGEIVSRINDLEILRTVISKVLINIFIDLPLTIISLLIMYSLNTTLFFIAIIIMFSYFLITLLFKRIFERHVDESHNKKAKYTSYMVESINGFETLKGSSRELSHLKRFDYLLANYLGNMARFENTFNNQFLLKEIIGNVGFLVFVLVGILLVRDDIITIGILLSFNTLLAYSLTPIRNILDFDIEIKRTINSISKIMNLYKLENDCSVIDKKFIGDIKFNNVSFKFDEKKIIDNFSLTIKKGTKVMLCGPSGSGKSTICKLLKKYYIVERNMIFINDIDINDYKTSDVVYVSQNEILFNDTIFNNIYKDIKIAKLCLVDEFVSNMPLGYNTLIEENGFNISSGQKQRVILSRALSKKFNILIIDEGLSQVGVDMERVILKNIFKKFKDKTIIFVSHRLDNLDLFDDYVNLKENIDEF